MAAFMATALACTDVWEPLDCGDKMLYTAFPTAQIDNISTLGILVKDAESGDLIPDLNIDIHWSVANCKIAEVCPSKCVLEIIILTEAGVTNSVGIYNSTDVLWTSEDKRDRVLANVYVRDPEGIFTFTWEFIQFIPNETSKSITIKLLRNSSL